MKVINENHIRRIVEESLKAMLCEVDKSGFYIDLKYFDIERKRTYGDMGYFFEDMSESWASNKGDAIRMAKDGITYYNDSEYGPDIVILSVVRYSHGEYTTPIFQIANCSKEFADEQGMTEALGAMDEYYDTHDDEEEQTDLFGDKY